MSAGDTYPPLTPLSEMPLHSGRSSDSRPWACLAGMPAAEQALIDGPCDARNVLFDWRCRDCVGQALSYLYSDGEDGLRKHGEDIDMDWRPTPDAPDAGPVKLSWLVTRARYWLEGFSSVGPAPPRAASR